MVPERLAHHVRARLLEPDVIFTTHEEVQATYTLEEAQAEVRRALEAGFDLEAARRGCPFKVDIPAYFARVAEGDDRAMIEGVVAELASVIGETAL